MRVFNSFPFLIKVFQFPRGLTLRLVKSDPVAGRRLSIP